MSDPLVSVIVPLFNYEKYIADCIRSIQNQDYKNLELIVSDDCSTDNSYQIAKSFECSNVKIIRMENNVGYSKAKNEAIIISQGELITCLDADDMFTKNSISCRVRAIQEKGAALVHANAITVRGGIALEQCYQLTPPYKRESPKVHAQTVMLKRKVHKRFGLYDENLRSRADKEMWIRLFGNGCAGKHLVKKKFIKRDVAYYRKHKQSMMSKRKKNKPLQKALKKQLQAAIKMRARHGITQENTRFLS